MQTQRGRIYESWLCAWSSPRPHGCARRPEPRHAGSPPRQAPSVLAARPLPGHGVPERSEAPLRSRTLKPAQASGRHAPRPWLQRPPGFHGTPQKQMLNCPQHWWNTSLPKDKRVCVQRGTRRNLPKWLNDMFRVRFPSALDLHVCGLSGTTTRGFLLASQRASTHPGKHSPRSSSPGSRPTRETDLGSLRPGHGQRPRVCQQLDCVRLRGRVCGPG